MLQSPNNQRKVMPFDNKVHLNMGIDETNDYKQPLRLDPASGLSHNDHL